MLTCPGKGLLLRYSRGGGDASDLAGVGLHLESCEACRRRAAELARAPVEELDPGRLGLAPVAGGGHADGGSALIDPPADVDPGDPAGGDAPGPAAEDLTADPLDTVSESLSPTPYSSYPRGQDRGRGPFPTFKGYEVMERLGGGGMGVVYKARQVGLNRLVALKMIREDRQMRTDYLARFMYEAEAVAGLRHPNIIQIFDIGEVDGSPFVALEFLEGGNLDDKLAGNPQPGRTAAEMTVILARAVHVAHQAGIIHRDLKPSNVLLSVDGVLKISDFGLAKRIDGDSKQTNSDQIMGTPSYMAPEQAGNSKLVGPPADVYSLGAIFYEMLVGRPPFKGDTGLETVRQVINNDPVPPSRLVPRIARDLETICLKCLAKDPLKRYRSAEALADDLQRYLDGEPIEARPTPPWERAIKWARRRPATATFLAFGVLLCLGVSMGLLEYQRIREERIAIRWKEGNRTIRKAYDALAQDRLAEARELLAAFQEDFARDFAPRLRELKTVAGSLLDRIDKQLEEKSARDREFASFDKFRGLRDEALFHDIPIPGLDPEGDRDAKRRAAEAALEVFKAPGAGAGWALALPSSLVEKEVEIVEDCYALLLILAGTEASAEQGLRRLDHAKSLYPTPTRAYHLRRAACLAGAGNGTAAAEERRRAESLPTKGALDHFLVGQECYKRDPATALRHFNDALQERPYHFWAQCLSALCQLDPQISQPEVAIARLDSCLKSHGEYAWLYLLRGSAYSLNGQLLLGQGNKPSSRQGGGQQLSGRAFSYAEMNYDHALLPESGANDELRYALLMNRALVKLESGRSEKAADDLNEAITLDKKGAHAYALLGRVYLNQPTPDPDAAFEQFSQAIELDANRAEYYRRRAEVALRRPSTTRDQRAAAVRDLDRAIRLERPQDQKSLALDHLDRALLLVLDHHDAEALAECKAAIAANGDEVKAHELRIKLLSDAKQHAAVIFSCNELIARGWSSPALIERRALSRAYCDDYLGAIDDYTRLLVFRPDRAPLLRARGRLYLLDKEPQRALRDFQDVLGLNPLDGDSYTDRGSALVSLGRSPEALSDAEEALKYGEPTYRRYFASARIYALASTAAAAEIRTKGRAARFLSDKHRGRAEEILLEALKRFPREREQIWREVKNDPDLRTIHWRLGPASKPAEPMAARPSSKDTPSK